MPVLIDSSFLLALYSADDRYHEQAVHFALSIPDQTIVPTIILTEVAYLLKRDAGHPGMTRFLRHFSQTKILLESVEMPDLYRAYEIASTYNSAEFDFVDCCIMALSERLKITQVCTYDRRDFSIFRPQHCDYLELLP